MTNGLAETLEAIKDAYQEGYKNATKNALQFIKENIGKYACQSNNLETGNSEFTLTLNFEEDFKKFMEGELL